MVNFFNLDMISKSSGTKQAHFNWLTPLKSICKSEEKPRITSNVETKDDGEQMLRSKELVLDSFLIQRKLEEFQILLEEITTKSSNQISDMEKELTAIKTALKENGIQIQ